MSASSGRGRRVVLVTGASSGIGRAVAHRLAEAGDHVVLLARGRSSLDDAARECDDRGAATTTVLAVDVGDDGAVAEAVESVLARHGSLDAVVHCAGVVAYGRTEDVPREVFDGVLRTNLHGSANLARHVIPVMRARNHGTLILTGSVIGHIAVPTMSAYAVSKWGVRALARQLHVENLDKPGVHVVHLAPGGVDTPIYLQAGNVTGAVGRPPPPVYSPERVARTAVRLLDHPRPRRQAGLANDVIRFGFSATPWLFDRLVRPLFPLGAQDQTTVPEDAEGNVLRSRAEGNRLRGGQGSSVLGIIANLRQHVGRSREGIPGRAARSAVED